MLLDVAYQSDPHLTQVLVDELGSARVVFGTDQPFYSPKDVLESVEVRSDLIGRPGQLTSCSGTSNAFSPH